MAHPRSMAADLARLLSAVPAPIYVLNGERQIVFANSAFAAWLAIPLEQLVGLTVAYHSNSMGDAGSATAAGLCPPPEVFSGRRMKALVASGGDQTRLSRRRAEFIPLGAEDDEFVAILAMVESTDVPDDTPPTVEEGNDDVAEASALHERLRRFHSQLRAPWQVDRLVGDSPAMIRVRTQVQLAWTSRASVVIVGPPGSGRQHVAKAIHYGQPAEEIGDLTPLSCSLLPSDVLQSAIGKMVRPSSATQTGSLGTVLLGDVDQLPADVQSELADLLARHVLPPRIIATSISRLSELVEHRQFRAGLAAHLSTIEILMPPLAERREDIPLLAQMFLEEFNAEDQRQLQGFTPEALDQLAAYAWPGNIDELSSMVQEACRAAEGRLVTPRDLPQRIYHAAAAERRPRRGDDSIDLAKFLARAELELIERALRRAKGNKTKAAKLLGLTRPRLYRRMVQLGLEKEN
jgi:DNA-binding NtrC family response regulator